MIIQCNQCRTKFNLDIPDKAERFRVKCGVCEAVFHVDPGKPDREPRGIPEIAFQPAGTAFDLISEKQELDLFLAEVLKFRQEGFKAVPPSPEKMEPPPAGIPPEPLQGPSFEAAKSKSAAERIPGRDRPDVPYEAGPEIEPIRTAAEEKAAVSEDQEKPFDIEPLVPDREAITAELREAAGESGQSAEDLSFKSDSGYSPAPEEPPAEPAGGGPADRKPRSLPKMTDISLMDMEEEISQAPIPDLSKDILQVQKKVARLSKSKAKRHPRSGLRVRHVGFLIVALLLVCAGLSWLYPQAGHEVLRWASANVPALDQFLEVKKEVRPIDPVERIQITGLSQRFVINAATGKIRVIEGFILNEADYPVSRVRLMAKLYDARSTLLAVKVVHCGNILDNSLLEKMDEQQIMAALSKVETDSIRPKMQIPFMVVFPNEPPGVTQAFVAPLSAERASEVRSEK